jgi:hypothetical protein
MPQHNSAQPTKTRSAVTGRQLGRAAQRAEDKNAIGAARFIQAVEKGRVPDSCTMGRVIRGTGGGRVEVLLYTGETGSFRIGGRIAFHGNAATKTDRAACMCAGDYIVVDGLLAIAKLSNGSAQRLAAILGEAPPGFLEAEEASGDGFEWDRSEEEKKEKEAAEKVIDLKDL